MNLGLEGTGIVPLVFQKGGGYYIGTRRQTDPFKTV
jgi:hypothetical protein